MWYIFEHRNLNRGLNKLPVEIRKKYEKWKDIVELSGPDGLRQIKAFRDERLTGNWRGYRSSRLNQQYRVIYQIKKREFFVQVIDITAHDYRKKMTEFKPAKKRLDISPGESVRILRELQELSQKQLAELTDIPQSTISAIENERINLGVERAKVLARALRCHPAVLVFPGWNVSKESAA